MKFGKSGVNTEESIIAAGLEPGIYRSFRLAEVVSKKAEKQDGSEGKHILNFVFKGKYEKDDVQINGTHQHTEWDPADDEKKGLNLQKRVEHILAKFISREQMDELLDKIEEETFEGYANEIAKIFNSPEIMEKRKNQKVTFKIVGNVYMNKKRAGFPLYVGFIVKDGEDLKFSTGEDAANAQYFNFKPRVANNPLEGSEESGGDDDGLPF